MANASHPHLFKQEWLERHPRLAAKFGKETVALILGILLAIATLLATSLDWAQKILWSASQVVAIASRTDPDASLPPTTNDLFDQFIEQKRTAKTEDLPDQF